MSALQSLRARKDLVGVPCELIQKEKEKKKEKYFKD